MAMAGWSMYSMATGMIPDAMMAETQRPASFGDANPTNIGRAPSAICRMRTRALGQDAEWPPGADHRAEEIETVAVEGIAADVQDVAAHRDEANPQDVVGRH